MRRVTLWEEVQRRYASDCQLWSSECRKLEEDRSTHSQTATEQDARFGNAIRAGAGEGALNYVLERHQRVWNENLARIDGLVRSRYLALAGQPNSRSQVLRALCETIPDFIKQVAEAERIEIRAGLSLERLARTAPNDHGLFAGEWFVQQFEAACRKHVDWKERNPNSWLEVRDRFEPRERGVAFEQYLKGVLESAGCDMAQMTKASGDYGADLLIDHRGRRIILQAKSYSEKVGLDAVQEVATARKVYHAQEAWVVTDNEFTANARALAVENDVHLIDRNSLDSVGTRVLQGSPAPLVIPARSDQPQPAREAEPSGILLGSAAKPPLKTGSPPTQLRRYALKATCALIAVLVVGGAVWMASGKQKADERAAIAVVDRWATSTRSLNIDGLLACYAPRLKHFYRLTDVGFDEVAQNKRNAFREFSETRVYRLRNMTFEHVNGNEEAVVFDKDWDFQYRKSTRHYSGSGRQKLTVDRVGSTWLITGEEDVSVPAGSVTAVGRR